MSDLSQHLDDYLTVRRRLGFKLERHGRLLPDFVRHLESDGATLATLDLALAWAKQPADGDPEWWAQRFSLVRGFARYLHGLDPGHEVPPPDLLPSKPRRAEPYLYTEAEITALMGACADFPSALKAANYRTLVGLLAATGMRVGEAIALDRGDIDWSEGVITVRDAKWGKDRELVVHPTTVDALRDYDSLRRLVRPRPRTSAFLVSGNSTRLNYKIVHRDFHKLTRAVGLQPRSARCRPRPHDLRHSFAVNAVLGWYRSGVEVDSRLHLLSTYLGHSGPEHTYWYLSASPELMSLAAGRLERSLEESR